MGAAREKVRVARALGKLPVMDDALRRGVLSYSKVRAMTRIAKPENDGPLVEMALHATGAQLERICRGVRQVRAEDEPETALEGESRFVRARRTALGTVRIEAELHPDEAALVLQAIEHARHQLRAAASDVSAETSPTSEANGTSEPAMPPPRPTRADGLVAVAESFLAHGPESGKGGERTQIFVHLAQSALAADGALAATLEDGTHVSAETFRRLACDSGLLPVAVDEHGRPLDVGRSTRKTHRPIRRALWLRDRGCRFLGCRNQLYLHGHHIQHWIQGGETRIDNLLFLCALCRARHNPHYADSLIMPRAAGGVGDRAWKRRVGAQALAA